MRYAGISVQKYDVKTHKNHENTGSVPARSPALSPEQGTAAGATPPGSSRPGKPRHGKACPVAPASTRAPVTTFVRSPAGNPGTVVCHVAALRLPSRACRREPAIRTGLPSGGTRQSRSFHPYIIFINVHPSRSCPWKAGRRCPFRHVRRRGPRAASGLSGTGHAVYRSAFSRVPCSVKIFASCRDRSGPFLALTWTRGTYMIVY